MAEARISMVGRCIFTANHLFCRAPYTAQSNDDHSIVPILRSVRLPAFHIDKKDRLANNHTKNTFENMMIGFQLPSSDWWSSGNRIIRWGQWVQ